MSQWADSIKKDIESSVTCDDLKNIEKEVQKVLQAQEKALEQMLSGLSSYLPLLTMPGVDPAEIVKFLGKLVSGTVQPFITAYEEALSEITKVTSDISEIAGAFESKIAEMGSCVAGLDTSTMTPSSDLLTSAQSTLTEAQTKVAALNSSSSS